MLRTILFAVAGIGLLIAASLPAPAGDAAESATVQIGDRCRVECGALGQPTTNVECRAISAENCAALKQSLGASCRVDPLPANWCTSRARDSEPARGSRGERPP